MTNKGKTSQPSQAHRGVTQPLVTVVIPTMNRPAYLKQALSSVLAQSYQNIEVLVRDNGDNRDTVKVLDGFNDGRVHYLRHPQNIGMTANIVGGFRQARGKYVANLHDDDFWSPDFLTKMVSALEAHPEAVLAFSDHYIVDSEGRIRGRQTEENTARFGRADLGAGIHRPFKVMALSDFTIPVVVAAVLRRDAIDWTDFPNLSSAYDYWLMYLASRDGGACYYIRERLAFYRIHTTSESAVGRTRLSSAFIEIYHRLLQDHRVNELHDEFRRALALHQTEGAIAFLRQGNRDAARQLLSRELHQRFSLKRNLTYAASYLPPMISRRLPGKYRFPAAA
ncbi:MAG TPA: glycosyltransferase family 2 protein [Chthoniobacterales bacterium]|nr:glycosyltransferase family 2 protein [Chthoniobacterales bacterium]